MQSSGLRTGIRAFVRDPLVHFLLIGAAIYGLYGLTRPDVEGAVVSGGLAAVSGNAR